MNPQTGLFLNQDYQPPRIILPFPGRHASKPSTGLQDGYDKENTLPSGPAKKASRAAVSERSNQIRKWKEQDHCPPCAGLPFYEVDNAQIKSVHHGRHFVIPPSFSRLRFSLTGKGQSQLNQSNVISTNRSDKFVSHCMDYKGPIFYPGEIIEHCHPSSYFNSNKSVLSLNTSLQSHKLFIQQHQLDVVVILYDKHMQIMGSYDSSSFDLLPRGVKIAPDYISSQYLQNQLYHNINGEASKSFMNMLELNFDAMNENIFAIVPVIVNRAQQHSPHRDSKPYTSYTCDVFAQCQSSLTTTLPLPVTNADRAPIEGWGDSTAQKSQEKFSPTQYADIHQAFIDAINQELVYAEKDQYGVSHCVSPPLSYIHAKCDGLEDEYIAWINSTKQSRISSGKIRPGKVRAVPLVPKNDSTHIKKSSAQRLLVKAHLFAISELQKEFELAQLLSDRQVSYLGGSTLQEYSVEDSQNLVSLNQRPYSPPRRDSKGNLAPSPLRIINQDEEMDWLTRSWSIADAGHYNPSLSVSFQPSVMFHPLQHHTSSFASSALQQQIGASFVRSRSAPVVGRLPARHDDHQPPLPALQEDSFIGDCVPSAAYGHVAATPFLRDAVSGFFTESANEDEVKAANSSTKAIIPFVVFRASEVCKGWHLDLTCRPVMRPSGDSKQWSDDEEVETEPEPGFLLEEVTAYLAESNFVPFHVLHVEHCVNCESHQSTTRHVPRSYEKALNDLISSASSSLPPLIVVANSKPYLRKRRDKANHLQQGPRIGAFEVALRPYGSDTTSLVFSKVAKRTFPSVAEICRELSSILLPAKAVFDSVELPTIEVLVFDSYFKRPVDGAEIVLQRVGVHPRAAATSTGGRLAFSAEDSEKCDETDGDVEPSRLERGLESLPEQFRLKAPQQVARAEPPAVGLGASSNQAWKSWKRNDVIAWFANHGVKDSVINNAVAAGAVDGPSFAKLVNASTLQGWGLKNRRELKQLDAELYKLLNSNTGVLKSSLVSDRNNQDHHNHQPTPESDASPVRKDRALVAFENVVIGRTSPAGYFRYVVPERGAYLITVRSDRLQPYTSHVITVDKCRRFGYAAIVKPRLERVTIAVHAATATCSGVAEAVDMSAVEDANAHIDNISLGIAAVPALDCDASKVPIFSDCCRFVVWMNLLTGIFHFIWFPGALSSADIQTDSRQLDFATEVSLPCGLYLSCITGEVVNLSPMSRTKDHIKVIDNSSDFLEPSLSVIANLYATKSPRKIAIYSEQRLKRSQTSFVMYAIRTLQRHFRHRQSVLSFQRQQPPKEETRDPITAEVDVAIANDVNHPATSSLSLSLPQSPLRLETCEEPLDSSLLGDNLDLTITVDGDAADADSDAEMDAAIGTLDASVDLGGFKCFDDNGYLSLIDRVIESDEKPSQMGSLLGINSSQQRPNSARTSQPLATAAAEAVLFPLSDLTNSEKLVVSNADIISATKIQSNFRRYQCYWSRKAKLILRSAAITIQTIIRRFLYRCRRFNRNKLMTTIEPNSSFCYHIDVKGNSMLIAGSTLVNNSDYTAVANGVVTDVILSALRNLPIAVAAQPTEEEEAAAVVKVQAHFRGRKVRLQRDAVAEEAVATALQSSSVDGDSSASDGLEIFALGDTVQSVVNVSEVCEGNRNFDVSSKSLKQVDESRKDPTNVSIICNSDAAHEGILASSTENVSIAPNTNLAPITSQIAVEAVENCHDMAEIVNNNVDANNGVNNNINSSSDEIEMLESRSKDDVDVFLTNDPEAEQLYYTYIGEKGSESLIADSLIQSDAMSNIDDTRQTSLDAVLPTVAAAFTNDDLKGTDNGDEDNDTRGSPPSFALTSVKDLLRLRKEKEKDAEADHQTSSSSRMKVADSSVTDVNVAVIVATERLDEIDRLAQSLTFSQRRSLVRLQASVRGAQTRQRLYRQDDVFEAMSRLADHVDAVKGFQCGNFFDLALVGDNFSSESSSRAHSTRDNDADLANETRDDLLVHPLSGNNANDYKHNYASNSSVAVEEDSRCAAMADDNALAVNGADSSPAVDCDDADVDASIDLQLWPTAAGGFRRRFHYALRTDSEFAYDGSSEKSP